jgi:hypothetical protein
MATVTRDKGKGGSIVYRVRVRVKGHPTLSASFPSLREAKQWAAKAEAGIFTQRHSPERSHSEHTLGEAIERYLREVLPHKKPNTIKGQILLLRYWATHLGAYKLSELTPNMIASCRDTLARTRKSSSVNRFLSILSHVFNVSIKEWVWMDKNPMSKVRKPIFL